MKKIALALLLLAAPLAAQSYSPKLLLGVPTAGVGYVIDEFKGKADCFPGNRILQPNAVADACIVARYGHQLGCPPPGYTLAQWPHYCAEREVINAIILHYACLDGQFGPGHGECEPTVQEMADASTQIVRGSAWACTYWWESEGGTGATAENPTPISMPVGTAILGTRTTWQAGLQRLKLSPDSCPTYYFNTPPNAPPPVTPPSVTPPPVTPPACPPVPVCQSVPPEVRTELQAALDRLAPFRYKLRARVRAAMIALDSYKPCL